MSVNWLVNRAVEEFLDRLIPAEETRWTRGPVVTRSGDDAEGRLRRAVYLAPEVWAWLEATAARDGTSRSDLLEGLVLLAMDRADRQRGRP